MIERNYLNLRYQQYQTSDLSNPTKTDNLI